jgi:taurine dioxygenase
MSFSIRRTSAPLGAIVTGLDPEGVSRGEAADLQRAFLKYGVLVFKGLVLDDDRQLELAKVFGEPQPTRLERFHLANQPLVMELSSKSEVNAPDYDPDPEAIVGALRWHSDSSYTETPHRGTLLRALVVPEVGGDTGWVDRTEVYRGLPYRLKCKLQGLRIIHSYAHTGRTTETLPDVSQPLVYAHPETDDPVLNISPSMALRIDGLAEDEGADLLASLIARLTEDSRIYRHHWDAGDVVVWDNWRTIHRAYGHPQKYPRVMRRTALKSDMRLGRWLGGAVALGQVA